MPLRSQKRGPGSCRGSQVAVAARGRFVMAVSGGRTPWQLLRAWREKTCPGKGVHVVQVDERIAPAGDPRPEPHATCAEACSKMRRCRPKNLRHAGRGERPRKPPLKPTSARCKQLAGTPPVSTSRTLGSARTATRPRWCRAIQFSTSPTRCGADRHLPETEAHDVDLPDTRTGPANPLVSDRAGQGGNAAAFARGRCFPPGVRVRQDGRWWLATAPPLERRLEREISMRVGIATDHGGFALKEELVGRIRASGQRGH